MKTVFTNGCFDILHPGHLLLLRDAKRCGDLLVVGLNSDASVREIKGNDRPIHNQLHRRLMLEALECVDLVIVFDEVTPLRLIKDLRPDVLVKGSDYESDKIVGAGSVKSWGGSVRTVTLIPGLSTTKIIDQIKKS